MLEFGLNGLVIMGIGTGSLASQHLAFRHLTDEHHMAAQVYFLQHLAAEHGVGVFRQVNKTVVAALKGIAI